MRHMELLYHFQTNIGQGLELGDFVDTAIRQAFETPWLMDQVLAISAASMHSVQSRKQYFDQAEATVLQMKALARFNAKTTQLSARNRLPVYLFSVLVAIQSMFDTLSTRSHLPAFTAQLATWFNLCRGTAAIIDQSFTCIPRLVGKLSSADSGEYQQNAQCPGETDSCYHFADLIVLVETANLDKSSITASRQVIQILHSLYHVVESPGTSSTERVLLVMQWPILTPPEYVQLVDQSRPEALVILAHYAVFLHKASYFWAIGDSGKFIIQSITRYLGLSWARWLAWPNEALNTTD